MSKKSRKARQARYEAELLERQSRWKRVSWFNQHPLVVAIVAVTAVVAAVISVGFLIADHTAVDTNLAVCRSIEATRLNFLGSAHDYSEPNWITKERASAVEQHTQAADGSDLEAALLLQIDAFDGIAAWAARDPTIEYSGENWLEALEAANGEITLACKSAGFTFSSENIHASADGSISQADALTYCNATLDYMNALASSEVGDTNVIQAALVMVNSADAGLPSDVLDATRGLTMVMSEAMHGRGYPDGEAAFLTVREFCQSKGAQNWP